MAELAGTIMGGVSVAGLFNNCVDSFGYVQLARNFGNDYQICQLRLNSYRNRLSRWGVVTKVQEDPRYAVQPPPEDGDVGQTKDILEGIAMLFQGAEKKEKRYAQRVNLSVEGREILDTTQMSPTGQRVHNHQLAIATKRQVATSLFKKSYWALYDSKSFGKLLDDLSSLIQELEEQLPADARDHCRRLVESEIADINDEPSLATLQDASKDSDELLLDSVNRKLVVICGSNKAGIVQATKDAEVRVGHEYNDSFLAQGANWKETTRNEAGDISAADKARVHIGSRFGEARLQTGPEKSTEAPQSLV